MTTLFRRLIAALLLGSALIVFVAPAPEASAQLAGECNTDSPFFAADVDRVNVLVPVDDSGQITAQAERAVALLERKYGTDGVTMIERLSPREGPRARRVVVEAELAEPSAPRWFANDPTTIFVHGETVEADIADLLGLGEIADCSPTPDSPDSPESLGSPGSTGPSGPEAAASAASSGHPVAAIWHLTDETNEVLTGYADSASFDVELPAGWDLVGDATLITDVVASEIARADMSLRFDIDGRPASTWTVDQQREVRVAIPAATFEEPFTLDAETTTPIVEDAACSDPRHVGRWVDIGQPRIEASIAPHDVDVARAVRGLGPASYLTGQPLFVSVPSTTDAASLEIGGAVISAIGRFGPPAEWQVLDGSTPPVGSGIIIEPIPGEPGVISVDAADGQVRLVFRGDPVDLMSMAKAMNDSDRLLFFHGQEIGTGAVPAPTFSTAPEVFRFQDAGYDDRTLRGSGAKSLVYRVHIPAGVPPDSATLALYGTYAPALAAKEATVSIRINGSEEQIVALLDDSGQLEVLHTLRPANLRPGLNFVKITVQLGAIDQGQCSGDNSAWFTVSSTSALGAEAIDGPQDVRLGVEDARFALASAFDFAQADVVVPNAVTGDELSAAFDLISELAFRGEGGAPRLVTDANVDRSRHLVLFGRAEDRPLLADIPYVGADSDVGVVAAVPSPHAPGRVVLAFTGGSDDAVVRAMEAGLSSAVNDLASPYALVSIDAVRPVTTEPPSGSIPDSLPFRQDDAAPSASDYETWLLEQASRIEAANAPEVDNRRTVAVALLLAGCVVAGLVWIRRSRQADVAGH